MENREFFNVEKVQLGAVTIDDDNNGIIALNDYVMPDSYGMYRTDTKECLGVVGSQYVPVQNNALYDVVREAAELSELNHEDVRFIELAGGRKVAFQVLLPEWDLTGDKVTRYASALNSHDGSSSLAMGMVGTRIICQNTWLMAYRNCRKARHSASITEQVKVMRDELLQSIEIDKNLFEQFEKLWAEEYTSTDHTPFIKELIGYDLEELELVEANTTKRRNKFEGISTAIDVELKESQSLWGVFNGVTRYVNHELAPRKEDPTNFIYFGTGRQMIDKALQIFSMN
jgi:hypothetical protein